MEENSKFQIDFTVEVEPFNQSNLKASTSPYCNKLSDNTPHVQPKICVKTASKHKKYCSHTEQIQTETQKMSKHNKASSQKFKASKRSGSSSHVNVTETKLSHKRPSKNLGHSNRDSHCTKKNMKSSEKQLDPIDTKTAILKYIKEIFGHDLHGMDECIRILRNIRTHQINGDVKNMRKTLKELLRIRKANAAAASTNTGHSNNGHRRDINCVQ